jgi:hypothetical protein
MTNITKVSNIVSVKENSNLAKSYFGSIGQFSANTVSNVFVINIGRDFFEIPLGSLQVNGVTITTMSQGITMLSAVFSS